MANYPAGISLNGASQFAVILELTDTTIENTSKVQYWGSGYVRQKGALAEGYAIDDFVQYDVRGQVPFQQGSITFAYILISAILFKQTNVP